MAAALHLSSSMDRHHPRERQFLPLPPRSWGDDPARLHQLMMGSLRFGPQHQQPPQQQSVATAVTAPSANSSSVRDLGGVFDLDQPLPSGWERCLDLKSGEVFIVKSASNVNAGMERKSRSRSSQKQQENWQQAWESSTSSKKLPDNESRQDWSLRWLPRKTAVSSEDVCGSGNGYKTRDEDGGNAKMGEERSPTGQVEREPLCLDLDLKLTSEQHPPKSDHSRKCLLINELPSTKRRNVEDTCKVRTSSAVTATSARPPLREENMLQQWSWQSGISSDQKASIQEAATESTMATAVCSKCLMYVLLRKTNPTCPRCSNLIILDCPWPRSSKRPRLELSPDDLSLSH